MEEVKRVVIEEKRVRKTKSDRNEKHFFGFFGLPEILCWKKSSIESSPGQCFRL